MATIMEFAQLAKRYNRKTAAPSQPAKILFFTGVRRERIRQRPARAAAVEYVRKLREENTSRS